MNDRRVMLWDISASLLLRGTIPKELSGIAAWGSTSGLPNLGQTPEGGGVLALRSSGPAQRRTGRLTLTRWPARGSDGSDPRVQVRMPRRPNQHRQRDRKVIVLP